MNTEDLFFYCTRYWCTLSVKACLSRRALVLTSRRCEATFPVHPGCASCDQGAAIAQRHGALPLVRVSWGRRGRGRPRGAEQPPSEHPIAGLP